jgi:hypothetical protein
MSLALIVLVTLALFFVGIIVGVIAIVSVAVRREERDLTLAVDAPDRMSRGARRLNGLSTRTYPAR